MARTIHKYSLPLLNSFGLDLPDQFTVLDAGLQGGNDSMEHLKAWVELDSDDSISSKAFGIFGTGHTIPDGAVHLKSFQAPPFVWHLYSLG